MASPVTIILLIVDYHAAIGGKTPLPPLPTLLSLKHIFTQPVGSLMYSSCCSRSITDWSLNLSIRSTSHLRCGSCLMARYSWMNDASQWENGKFDPLPRPNPLTDRHKKLHTTFSNRPMHFGEDPISKFWDPPYNF